MDKSLEGIIRSINKKVGIISARDSIKKEPLYHDIVYDLQDRGDIIVFGHQDGVSYGYDRTSIYKTTDNWVNKESIFERPSGTEIRVADYASMAKILKNGRIIIALTSNPRTETYGYLYISDENKENFTKVLDMPGGIPTGSWGFKDFGSYLFASEYAAGDVHGRRAYMSTDGGLNWKMIYERPLSDINTDHQCHIHDVGYDPYRNIVWLAFGDGDNRKLMYSHNFGEDWLDLYAGYPPIDPIGILATPNYTLFGSDTRPNGIDVLPHSDITSTKFLIPDGLTRRWNGDKDGDTIALVSNATLIDGIYYFATTFSTKRKIAMITCTPDGWNFYDVINIDIEVEGEGVSGFINLFEDDEGNLRCATRVRQEGTLNKELIIKKPEFG